MVRILETGDFDCNFSSIHAKRSYALFTLLASVVDMYMEVRSASENGHLSAYAIVEEG